MTDKPKPIKWFKVLNQQGFAKHGGNYQYGLPTFNRKTGQVKIR